MLTPHGGGNTNATYDAPASNPNCANNPIITLIDCCRNTAEIQLAVNCASYADAYRVWEWEDANGQLICYDIDIQPHVIPASEAGMYKWWINQNYYNCDATFSRKATQIYDFYTADDPSPQTSPHQPIHAWGGIAGNEPDVISYHRCPPPYVTEPWFGPWDFHINKFDLNVA